MAVRIIRKQLPGPHRDCLLVLAALTVLIAGCGTHRRWVVGEVRFQGNEALSRRALIRSIQSKPARFWRRVPFSASRLQDDVRTIGRAYRERGYLEADARVGEIVRDTLRRRVRVAIEIDEGPQTLIDTVVVAQAAGLPDEVLRRLVTVSPGKPYSPSQVQRDSRVLADSLGRFGYLYAEVDDSVRLDEARHRAQVSYSLRQGPLVRVSDIRVAGTRGVRSEVVSRELQFKKGELLTRTDVRSSVRRIYGTGLFSHVQIRAVPADTITADTLRDTIAAPVMVNVSEGDFLRVQAGVGYGTYEGFRTNLETSYSNLWHLGHTIGLRVRFSGVEQGGQVTYSTPWLLALPLNTNATAYMRHEDQTAFAGRREGFLLSLGSETNWGLLYRGWSRLEWVRFERLDTAGVPRDTPLDNTQSVGTSLAYDTRNNPLNPSQGSLSAVEGELAGLGGRGGNQFYRIVADERVSFSLFRKVRWSSALNFGFVEGYGASEGFVAPQERLTLGSRRLRPLRGYGEGEVADSGGTIAIVANVGEVRFPIFRWIGAAVFVDAGNVWKTVGEAQISDLRWTAGPGLRIDTPVGPASLDVGFRLTGTHVGAARFHFSVGQPF